MSRITTLLAVATHRIDVASIYPTNPTAPTVSVPHPVSGPLLVAVLLGIGVIMLIARVNSVIVNLVSQFVVQVAAAVGRMLILVLVLVVIGALILLRI